jgi:hypothetical protein
MYENKDEILNKQGKNITRKTVKKNETTISSKEDLANKKMRKNVQIKSDEENPQSINSSRIAVQDSEGESHKSSTKVDCPRT